MSDPIDLDAHRPHEVSKMLCARCGHKWTAVHPVGTTGLECPNCHGMKGYGMTDYTDLVAALRLPLHGSQQAWTCGKAADAIVSLAGEVAQLKAASRDIRYTHADQLARVRQAEVKAGRYKNWNDAYQIAITGLRAEEERLRAALRQIAEGTRDGQHCALIASVTLEDKEAVLGGASCHSAEHAMLESTPKGEQRD